MNFRIQAGIILVLVIVGSESVCQDTTGVSAFQQRLLTRIYEMQQYHEKHFPRGMIPSFREYKFNKGILKDDPNIFFTGLVIFTIRSLYDDLDKPSRVLCDSIISLAAAVYPTYQNHKGRPTYNYWRTDKPEIFPNAGWLNIFDKSKALPDDLDVTSIILMAANSSDSVVKQVHGLMQGYTNSGNKKTSGILPAYKKVPAYSTWFGEKMPVDLDICVLTNILYLVHKYKLPYTRADSASLEFIQNVVAKNDHINAPSSVSPYYITTPIILYHLSRLMATNKITGLEKWKPRLISDATLHYRKATNIFDKIILSTSLMRWGVMLPDDSISIKTGLGSFIENNDFIFFIADITSVLPSPFNKWLNKTGIGKFFYYCPGWNYALMLENITIRKRMMR